jgi:hypothetical protein
MNAFFVESFESLRIIFLTALNGTNIHALNYSGLSSHKALIASFFDG